METDEVPTYTKEQMLSARFENRRRMAWFSLAVILGVIVLFSVAGLFSDKMAHRVVLLLTPLALILVYPGTVVLTYFGTSTMEHLKNKISDKGGE